MGFEYWRICLDRVTLVALRLTDGFQPTSVLLSSYSVTTTPFINTLHIVRVSCTVEVIGGADVETAVRCHDVGAAKVWVEGRLAHSFVHLVDGGDA